MVLLVFEIAPQKLEKLYPFWYLSIFGLETLFGELYPKLFPEKFSQNSKFLGNTILVFSKFPYMFSRQNETSMKMMGIRTLHFSIFEKT